MLFAREGIFFLSGDAYKPATIPMIIIMPTLLTIGLTNIMGIQMLIPLGKEKMVLYSEVAGAVVDFVINMLLIPQMASAGAAIGTLVAECVVWLVQYYVLRNRVTKAYRNIQYKKLANNESKTIFGGRLGEYKYYDMDKTIEAVLNLCERMHLTYER